jgi:hypothetical protein
MASDSESGGAHVGGDPTLVPHENRFRSLILASEERRLRRSYNIPSSIILHFQLPEQLSIVGGDVTITERMLMAGFRFPLPEIARELLVRLGVAPSQVKPNGWRYFFASFVLWRTKLQKRMTIDQFLIIYLAGFRREGTVEFTVRKKQSIIHLAWRYSNKKEWKEQTFRVSSQWEKPKQLLFLEYQRVPRDWARMRVGASEAPDLNDEQVDNVDSILAFVKATSAEDAKVVLDFNHLVTNKNMRNILGYEIPISNLPFLKERKGKAQKSREDPTPTTLKGKEKVSDGPKKSKEPKKVPKTVKKLLADAQRIGPEQEAKAKKGGRKEEGGRVEGCRETG